MKDYFEELISPVTRQHLLYCDCCKTQIEMRTKDILRRMKKKIETGNNKNDKFNINTLETAQFKARKEYADIAYRDELKCSYEKEYINDIKIMFGKRYDLEDPNIYFIVGRLINHILSSYRLNNYSKTQGAMTQFVDKYGNTQLKINPAEWAKLKYDTEIVNVIEKLNNMTEGIKVNVRHTINIDEIIGNDNKTKNEPKVLFTKI